jgi:hypothetical protein
LTLGKKINKWTVWKLPVEDKVEVVCECNYVKTVNFHLLLAGKANYCKKCDRKPDMKSHTLYPRWVGMNQRTTDKKCRSWAYHGGRPGAHGGIKVCERWKNGGFWLFVEDMGLPPTPKHQLERVDNEGDYSPENVVWALPKQNARNRANNKWIEFENVRALAGDWEKILKLPTGMISRRIKAGWTLDGALQTPAREYKRKLNSSLNPQPAA